MARSLSAENIMDPNTKAVIGALLADLAALRAAHAILVAKLDLDAGVTDTNYGALASPATPQLGA